MKTGLIYKLTNTINNKEYVGQTINLNNRLQKHKYDRYPKAKKNSIQAAIQKYGFEAFTVTILEDNISKDKLDSREQYWINRLQTIQHGYNIAKGGHGGDTYSGILDDDMTQIKQKISKANRGNNNGMKRYGYKLAGERNGMYGRPAWNKKQVTIQNVETNEIKIFDSREECATYLGYKRGSNITAWKHNPDRIIRGYKLISL